MTCMLTPSTVNSWCPNQFDNYLSLDIGNRYFSRRSEVLSDEVTTFPSETDPTGILSQSAGGMFVHALDNRVQYYERVNGEEGSR